MDIKHKLSIEPPEEENVKVKDSTTALVVSWIRILLPMFLAALGWYISQVVGPLEDKIARNETAVKELVEAKNVFRTEITQLLKTIEHIEKDTHELQRTAISRDECAKNREEMKSLIRRLEDRVFK